MPPDLCIETLTEEPGKLDEMVYARHPGTQETEAGGF